MEIEKLFPLRARVTQDIIDNSKISSISRCIGANTLKNAINDVDNNYRVEWGVGDGLIINKNTKEKLEITTIEAINMMFIKKPQDVVFVIGTDPFSFSNQLTEQIFQ